MYVPAKFVTALDAAWGIVDEAGAGMFIVASDEGLRSVFVPVVVSPDRRMLTSHVARANPWWRGLSDGDEVIGLFVVASAYVSPTYYPSRIQDPNVVPTWNYVACELRGRASIHEDPLWLYEQVRAQTEHYEEGRTPSWRVDEAPREFIDRQLGAIVGLSVEVTAIEGKTKLSQNRPVVDHDAVREQLANGSATERDVARRMHLDE